MTDDDHARLLRGLLAAHTDLDVLPHAGPAGRVMLAAAVAGKGCSDDAVAHTASMRVVACGRSCRACSSDASTSQPCSRQGQHGTGLRCHFHGYPAHRRGQPTASEGSRLSHTDVTRGQAGGGLFAARLPHPSASTTDRPTRATWTGMVDGGLTAVPASAAHPLPNRPKTVATACAATDTAVQIAA